MVNYGIFGIRKTKPFKANLFPGNQHSGLFRIKLCNAIELIGAEQSRD